MVAAVDMEAAVAAEDMEADVGTGDIRMWIGEVVEAPVGSNVM